MQRNMQTSETGHMCAHETHLHAQQPDAVPTAGDEVAGGIGRPLDGLNIHLADVARNDGSLAAPGSGRRDVPQHQSRLVLRVPAQRHQRAAIWGHVQGSHARLRACWGARVTQR